MTRQCGSLDQVRAEIDRLDDSLLDLLAERSGYVQQAVRLKNRDQITDPERIEAILTRMRQRAVALDLEPDIAEAIWRRMIEAFINYEEKIYDDIHQ